MKLIPTLLLWVGMSTMLLAQENEHKVIAEQGDGIFSILRKQGLDPAKYYEKFITLNIENIKDGSMLHVGREYIIPKAKDSFKETGVRVQMSNGTVDPIFDAELATMSRKSNSLKNAVYYLIAENKIEAENKFTDDIIKSLAAELMVHGATVFVIESGDEKVVERKPLSEVEKMGAYVETINKRYLQNNGKYQRLLIIRANGLIKNGNMDVAVYHHNKSEKGQRFAENIQSVFKRNSISNRSYKDINTIFQDKNSLYLAKNTLPAITLLTIDSGSKISKKDGIPVRSDKKSFTNWVTSGILKDYADLSIEE
ncbi:N-acetylmuramoyl-L-alanine amidase [Flagellimonas eckloniae]|uniref:LysM domain-containing protein n=1 Tax=Flagellimonas eckloniae TaxID=346185 RepID=A0A0Q0X080_9FLAO|nr:N-acetylmuramoyl-L-alanine amidase [Allomuricauda eckloniae]KQC31048.1 hypothetical protein AAY42_14945 [Allomuricauda eckloniae]